MTTGYQFGIRGLIAYTTFCAVSAGFAKAVGLHIGFPAFCMFFMGLMLMVGAMISAQSKGAFATVCKTQDSQKTELVRQLLARHGILTLVAGDDEFLGLRSFRYTEIKVAIDRHTEAVAILRDQFATAGARTDAIPPDKPSRKTMAKIRGRRWRWRRRRITRRL